MVRYYTPRDVGAMAISVHVEEWGELHGWKPVDANWDFAAVANVCSCCRCDALRDVAWVKATTGYRTVGCCDRCGWLGYLQKPERWWFDRFYGSEWRKDEGTAERPAHNAMGRDVRVLEIGCGNGENLAALKAEGWNVYGIEPSWHRAKSTRDKGVDVYCGTFHDFPTPTYKIDVIGASHVLEHSYDPDAFIAKCSRIQDKRGTIEIRVPDALKEPSLGQLFFLPHLHSFTREALSCLLNRHGYDDIYFDEADQRQLSVRACKHAEKFQPERPLRLGGFFKVYAAKFAAALCTYGTYSWLHWPIYSDTYTTTEDGNLIDPPPGWGKVRSVKLRQVEPKLDGPPIQITMDKLELMVK